MASTSRKALNYFGEGTLSWALQMSEYSYFAPEYANEFKNALCNIWSWSRNSCHYAWDVPMRSRSSKISISVSMYMMGDARSFRHGVIAGFCGCVEFFRLRPRCCSYAHKHQWQCSIYACRRNHNRTKRVFLWNWFGMNTKLHRLIIKTKDIVLCFFILSIFCRWNLPVRLFPSTHF